MKKLFGILGIIFSFFIIYLLQVNFFSWFTIAGIKPNLFVVLILVVGLFAGKKIGAIIGLIFGLYLDVIIGKNIGLSGIILMIIGFSAGWLDKTFSKDSKITIILTVVVATIVFEVVTYIFNVLRFGSLFELIPFVRILGIELIFNILVTIIVYPLIRKFGYKLEDIFKQNKTSMKYF